MEVALRVGNKMKKHGYKMDVSKGHIGRKIQFHPLSCEKNKQKIREDMTSRKGVKFSYHLQISQNGKSCGFIVKSLKVYYIHSVSMSSLYNVISEKASSETHHKL